MKTTHFDRLIVERSDYMDVVIDGLDQAVFPVLRVFQWIAAYNKNRC